MPATIRTDLSKIELTESEWDLLRNYIIRDTIKFWEDVAKDIDGGLIPAELAPDHEMIDRVTLYNLKSKISKFWD